MNRFQTEFMNKMLSGTARGGMMPERKTADVAFKVSGKVHLVEIPMTVITDGEITILEWIRINIDQRAEAIQSIDDGEVIIQ